MACRVAASGKQGRTGAASLPLRASGDSAPIHAFHAEPAIRVGLPLRLRAGTSQPRVRVSADAVRAVAA